MRKPEQGGTSYKFSIINNFIDGVVCLSLAERNDFKTIEKVADLVDRSQDPVAEQEFGRKLLPAHQYIQDKTLKFYAKYLEKEYNQIIKQNYLPAVGTCRRLFFHF